MYPCFLCGECIVQGLQGRLRLFCVQDFPEEMAHLPAEALRRLRMVDEEVRNAYPHSNQRAVDAAHRVNHQQAGG